ncbi:MAG: hypothetical protein ACFNVM_02565, partial [Neisseria elongata]
LAALRDDMRDGAVNVRVKLDKAGLDGLTFITPVVEKADGAMAGNIVINATSGGLNGQAPDVSPAVFEHCELAYDMVYGREPTAFMCLARQNGAHKVSDGLGMLVGQAAESYRLWRGFSPDVQPVIETLRKAV